MTSLPVWRDSNYDVTSGLAGCSLWGMGQVMTTQCFRSTKFLFSKNHTKRNNVYLFIRFKIYFSYRGLSGGLFWEPCGSPPARAGCDEKKQRICKGTGSCGILCQCGMQVFGRLLCMSIRMHVHVHVHIDCSRLF